jgi:hypothetical protein
VGPEQFQLSLMMPFLLQSCGEEEAELQAWCRGLMHSSC